MVSLKYRNPVNKMVRCTGDKNVSMISLANYYFYPYKNILQKINTTINQSNQSINQSTNQSIIHSFNQSTNHSFNQSTNQSINQSICHSVYQSVKTRLHSFTLKLCHFCHKPCLHFYFHMILI